MARKKTDMEKLETKYGRLVRQCYAKYSTRPMEEFITELKKLKAKMGKEMEEKGLLKEEPVKNDAVELFKDKEEK